MKENVTWSKAQDLQDAYLVSFGNHHMPEFGWLGALVSLVSPAVNNLLSQAALEARSAKSEVSGKFPCS